MLQTIYNTPSLVPFSIPSAGPWLSPWLSDSGVLKSEVYPSSFLIFIHLFLGFLYSSLVLQMG